MSLPPELLLPPLTKLSPRVVRILGFNPGKFTLGGTNTYLVGTGQQRMLVDTGEGKSEYKAAIREAIQIAEQELQRPVTISAVLLTHWHYDHIGGVRDVLEMFPDAKVWKLASHSHDTSTAAVEAIGPPCIVSDPIAEGVKAFNCEGATLSIVQTPGHTDDHMSLLLEEERAVFSGDCILGAGSSVFACYSEFMSSLNLLRALKPAVIYPGHGPVVMNGVERIEEYISHREAREQQIIQAMSTLAKNGARTTITAIVNAVYTEIPDTLKLAAAGNTLHHLRKLLREQRVTTSAEASVLSVLEGQNDYLVAEGSSSGDNQMMLRIFNEACWSLAPNGSSKSKV